MIAARLPHNETERYDALRRALIRKDRGRE